MSMRHQKRCRSQPKDGHQIFTKTPPMCRYSAIAIVPMLCFVAANPPLVRAFSTRPCGGKGRYFSLETVLPPLDRIDGDHQCLASPQNCTFTIPYSSQKQRQHEVEAAQGGPLPTVYTNDPKAVNRWLMDNIQMDGCTIGFDTESVPVAPWVPNKYKGCPVTVQFATPESSLVVHLLRENNNNNKPFRGPLAINEMAYSRSCTPLIEAVLSDESIVKCGCGIDDDLLELRQCVPGMSSLNARSRLDVGLLGVDKERLGLKRLTRIVLDLDLKKPKRIARSNWGRMPLTERQVDYASRDAWSGAAILKELEAHDPDTFGTDVLVEILKSQRSLKESFACKTRRKRARDLLRQYLRPYSKNPGTTLPTNVAEKVRDLKGEITVSDQDNLMIEALGFIADEKKNCV